MRVSVRGSRGIVGLADADVVEETFGLEHVPEVFLQARVRHLHAVVPREGAVADAGEAYRRSDRSS